MSQPKRTWTKTIRPSRVDGDVGFLLLPDGREALVDASSLALVSGYNWSATAENYVVSGLGKLARVILDAKPGTIVDHSNGDRLDNRRANLRIVTPTQNCRNRRKASGKSSRFKGVSYRKDRGTWLVSIKVDGRLIKLGTFDSEIVAAKAYDRAALEHFGEFAVLNFDKFEAAA
jgi:hypothetical protein